MRKSHLAYALVLVLVIAAFLLVPLGASAATTLQFGNGTPTWPDTWVPLPALNDPLDSALKVKPDDDFIGNAADPAAFYAVTDDYIYFRMRVHVGAVDPSAIPSPTFAGDSFWIAVNNIDNLNPRYAFAWDTKGRPYTNHALEMNVTGKDESVQTWTRMQMDDRDGNEDVKIAPPDFRWNGGDGFIRTEDHVSTADFGETTYIDWAISKAYLSAYVPALLQKPSWRIQFISRTNGLDHDEPNADVAGGQLATSQIVWPVTINVSQNTSGGGITPPPSPSPTIPPAAGAQDGRLFLPMIITSIVR